MPISLISVIASTANVAQSVKLRDAIKEYEANKWKVIGQKVGKPAKVSIYLIFRMTFNLYIFTRLASNMPKNISRMFDHDDDASDEVMISFP